MALLRNLFAAASNRAKRMGGQWDEGVLGMGSGVSVTPLGVAYL